MFWGSRSNVTADGFNLPSDWNGRNSGMFCSQVLGQFEFSFVMQMENRSESSQLNLCS